jgi:hypothetical protein
MNTTAVSPTSNTRRQSIIVVLEDFSVCLLFIESTNAIELGLSNSKKDSELSVGVNVVHRRAQSLWQHVSY